MPFNNDIIKSINENSIPLLNLSTKSDENSRVIVILTTIEGFKSLATSISTNNSIKVIKLNMCALNYEAALILAEVLVVNQNIRILELKSNIIESIGASYIVDSLQHNNSLRVLSLEDNHIGPEIANNLKDMMNVNISLKSLDLSVNYLNSDAAFNIVANLNGNISYLNLSSNKIGTDGAIAIANYLVNDRALTYLNLGNNEISTEGFYALMNSLKYNNSLVYLSFLKINLLTFFNDLPHLESVFLHISPESYGNTISKIVFPAIINTAIADKLSSNQKLLVSICKRFYKNKQMDTLEFDILKSNKLLMKYDVDEFNKIYKEYSNEEKSSNKNLRMLHKSLNKFETIVMSDYLIFGHFAKMQKYRLSFIDEKGNIAIIAPDITSYILEFFGIKTLESQYNFSKIADIVLKFSAMSIGAQNDITKIDTMADYIKMDNQHDNIIQNDNITQITMACTNNIGKYSQIKLAPAKLKRYDSIYELDQNIQNIQKDTIELDEGSSSIELHPNKKLRIPKSDSYNINTSNCDIYDTNLDTSSNETMVCEDNSEILPIGNISDSINYI